MENNNYYAPENSLAADNGAAKQYIQTAGSLLVPAIIGLALALVVPFVGEVAGLILGIIVKSKISKLPVVNEATLDEATLAGYRSSRGKVKASGILSTIAIVASIVFAIVYILSFVVGFIGGLMMY